MTQPVITYDQYQQLLKGDVIELNEYLTAVYLPQSNTVVVDCPLGCCYESWTLQDFQDGYGENVEVSE